MDKLKPMYPPFISQREVVTEWGESQYAEGFAEGYAEGYAEGFAEGYAEGFEEGLAEAHIDTQLMIVKNLMQYMDLPAEEAMALLDLSESDRKTLLPLLQ